MRRSQPVGLGVQRQRQANVIARSQAASVAAGCRNLLADRCAAQRLVRIERLRTIHVRGRYRAELLLPASLAPQVARCSAWPGGGAAGLERQPSAARRGDRLLELASDLVT